ncbi:sensor histidine kinase [Levilactobacillus brevis]|nr:sensor histidine kinase [Levilactobacillus brevis]
MAGISAFVFLVAIIIAVWIARDLSKPLRQIVSFTHAVASGDYRNQLPQQTQIVEINALINVTNELSRQLSKNQALRERLSSDIAHELRTPLTTIQGSLEAMIDGIWPISEARLVSLNDEVIRLTHLINNIENIASIEHSEDKLIKVDTDLSKLIQQVLSNFQSNLEEKKITLDYHTEKVIAVIDPDKINQVITNLLSNAIKFTQTRGKIIIKLKRISDNIVLTVEDNGSGIAEKDVPHIFDHFYMADPARNRQQGGQGIGLAIVKTIVVAHGGSVSVDSKLGIGTIFTVKLPLNN